MSTFEHLHALRRQNKELLQKLKQKSESLPRLNSDCWGKNVENEAPECVSGVWRLVSSGARDRKRLIERKESLLNGSDAFIKMTVGENRSHVARNALCKPKNMTKTPNLAGEKVNSFTRVTLSLPVYMLFQCFLKQSEVCN